MVKLKYPYICPAPLKFSLQFRHKRRGEGADADARRFTGNGVAARWHTGSEFVLRCLLTSKLSPLSSFPSPRFLDLASSGGTGGVGSHLRFQPRASALMRWWIRRRTAHAGLSGRFSPSAAGNHLCGSQGIAFYASAHLSFKFYRWCLSHYLFECLKAPGGVVL